MSKLVFKMVAFSAAFILVAGCSTLNKSCKNVDLQLKVKSSDRAHRYKVLGNSERGWLSDKSVKRAVNEQLEMAPSADYSIQLRDLQKKADILMELWNEKSVKVLAVRSPISLPLGILPAAELQNYFTQDKLFKSPISLIVIINHNGDPRDPFTLIRTIDKTLRNAGVKRRVYECFGDNMCVKLDSHEQ